jgi:hypothetical protein
MLWFALKYNTFYLKRPRTWLIIAEKLPRQFVLASGKESKSGATGRITLCLFGTPSYCGGSAARQDTAEGVAILIGKLL